MQDCLISTSVNNHTVTGISTKCRATGIAKNSITGFLEYNMCVLGFCEQGGSQVFFVWFQQQETKSFFNPETWLYNLPSFKSAKLATNFLNRYLNFLTLNHFALPDSWQGGFAQGDLL